MEVTLVKINTVSNDRFMFLFLLGLILPIPVFFDNITLIMVSLINGVIPQLHSGCK